ncbi:VOC family protein [Legionella pneumophila serogroup 1]|uniref:VOC family protein n=1 Tax=Legionella pneumophila TaxID=446 RepID=UPI00026D9B54|nr:VOC family protein [Legionella pneumophila]MCK0183156.1 VOC family protein [Legionella pneumophila]MCK1880592.1 VOC family protein [Legionella pneumophila]MCK1889847.1 VOC family protein [Legionella pneumophila]MDG5851911.1 VOC family protein [Legionella pneumophila]MDI0389922.1 VOC family protein [Legionella pneumophila]
MTQAAFGEFCWNELATSDVKKAKDFYGKVFGWQFREIESKEMTYTIIQCNDKEMAGIWQIPKDQQSHIPPHWMAYIYVQDVSEALKKAKQHGAQEVKGITQAGEMGRFAIIVDPTGAHVALWESFE